jgi:uncharacterized membrane protein
VRTAAFLLALLGAVACVGLGLFLVGSAYARGEQVERLETSEHRTRFGQGARLGRADADARRNTAIVLLVAGLIGGAGAALVRRRPMVATPLLVVAGVAPAIVALWAVCPSAPLVLAALAALAGRDEPPPPEAPAYEPPKW